MFDGPQANAIAAFNSVRRTTPTGFDKKKGRGHRNRAAWTAFDSLKSLTDNVGSNPTNFGDIHVTISAAGVLVPFV